jgi:hypothetical protein
MKIVAHSPTQLIIRDTAMTLRAFGVFILLFGAIIVWFGVGADPDAGIAMVPTVIGSIVAIGGLAMIVLPAPTTFAFSKTDRVFVIAKQRIGRVDRQTIPLRDIADVSLEESSGDGGTYRIAVTLADRRRIPWTSYYTAGHATKRVMVQHVREFLDLEPTPALGSGVSTAKDERDLRRGRAGLYLMGAFCCLFFGFGVTMLMKEQRRLSVFQPVTATVLSTRVEEHSDSDGSTYEPVVVYRYRVNDREYTASRVTPLKESRSGGWARRVTSRYHVGSVYTAFYDPREPAEAFLMRSRSFLPWAFLIIPLMGMAFIVAGIRGSYAAERQSRWPRSASLTSRSSGP